MVEVKEYGKLADGTAVQEYTLSNANKITVKIITYGATITSISTPDKDGTPGDITLGFATLDDWVAKNKSYFGNTIGRYANRIAGGKFDLEGKTYTLATNNGANSLHGGVKGFDKVNWTGSVDGSRVKMSYVSADGEEGYPGKLSTSVYFSLSEENELSIEYEAETDAPTIVNLTNHTYFNLAGPGTGNVLQHTITSPSTFYTPVNDQLIPTGEIAHVKDTAFDFRKATTIGERIDQVSNGYDHNIVVKRTKKQAKELLYALTVSCKESGRSIEVETTEPGYQLYVGGFLDGSIVGREGKGYERFAGLCLETQHYPDSINQKDFPSVVLRPGKKFESTTVYRFKVQKARKPMGKRLSAHEKMMKEAEEFSKDATSKAERRSKGGNKPKYTDADSGDEEVAGSTRKRADDDDDDDDDADGRPKKAGIAKKKSISRKKSKKGDDDDEEDGGDGGSAAAPAAAAAAATASAPVPMDQTTDAAPAAPAADAAAPAAPAAPAADADAAPAADAPKTE